MSRMTVTYQAFVRCIKLTLFIRMSKIQGMTKFMHLNRQIRTPPIAVDRQPTVHVGVGDPAHGIFRKAIHGKVRELSRMSYIEYGVESAGDFISHGGVSLGDAGGWEGDGDDSVGEFDDFGAGVVGRVSGVGRDSGSVVGSVVDADDGGAVIQSHLIRRFLENQFVVTASLHLRHDVGIVDAVAEDAVSEIRFVEGRGSIGSDDSNDDDGFCGIEVCQVPLARLFGKRPFFLVLLCHSFVMVSFSFQEKRIRSLQIGGAIREELSFVGHRDGSHSRDESIVVEIGWEVQKPVDRPVFQFDVRRWEAATEVHSRYSTFGNGIVIQIDIEIKVDIVIEIEIHNVVIASIANNNISGTIANSKRKVPHGEIVIVRIVLQHHRSVDAHFPVPAAVAIVAAYPIGAPIVPAHVVRAPGKAEIARVVRVACVVESVGWAGCQYCVGGGVVGDSGSGSGVGGIDVGNGNVGAVDSGIDGGLVIPHARIAFERIRIIVVLPFANQFPFGFPGIIVRHQTQFPKTFSLWTFHRSKVG
mmetsp:Transcript_12512/g.25511  ORF Transcript_12512/g.25511 Transcript_12512/m.25511 type:complete len:528 (-) Transcript_12512:670-2253(-)